MNLRMLSKWLIGLIFLSLYFSCQQSSDKLLVFSKTAGFRHTSIEAGVTALQKLGEENGFEIIVSEDAAYFDEDSLKEFSAVIFLNTTGDVLNYHQQADFERYIQAGGGFVGVHSATDTEYDWYWYGKLVGGYFESHPKVQEAKLLVEDPNHISTQHLEQEWLREDEWYNFKKLNPNVNVLLSIDENSYEGGKNGDNHPMAWYHEYDGGRAFYTELGHTEAAFREEAYLKHLWGGIQYAVGNNQRDYSRAKTDRMPLENRFVRSILTQNLNEPMELDMLDEEQIIFVERKGAVKVLDLGTNTLETVAEIPVFSGFEDGLLGIAVDPNYAENNWIYLYYSPPGDEPKQHLSRFVFKDNQLAFESEKVVLEVVTQRDECCHAGGSVEFGPDGLLYLSTGDDTNPFASKGFAPIDEREGRAPWDAQRSSSNTNDLRGKVLRIRPEADGTYSIPEGNLFPEGTPNTRAEIYVMGCRNPFRISIDAKTNYLYWGDVGPDAGKDDETRGPKGHDEINQARQAGYWGWPYTRGDNKAYFDYDFAIQKSGERFNPQKIINNSPNNTGLQALPPIQKSLIWYSYDKSEEFPWTGVGGKNPMAGPIYYSDMFPNNDQKFPDYFNGKLFFYEWMRDWIFIVTLDENQDFQKAEPFMPNSTFSNPMDMIFGKDGNLYVLEYGEKWFAQNLDARLNKIEYVKGNRSPSARIESDRSVGAAPLSVQFSAKASEDVDGDALAYSWFFNGENEQSQEVEPRFTFDEVGKYRVKLTVTDPAGRSASSTQEILVGNEPPEVSIALAVNNHLYWDGRQLSYEVKVVDKEDGSTEDGSLDPSKVWVSLTYIAEGEDLVTAALGHQQQSTPKGKILIDASDCKACHALDKQINGPAYQDIAIKYNESDKEFLVTKILQGGAGVWGGNMMSAHPQLSEGSVGEMVDYILSLDQVLETEGKSLPLKGSVTLRDHIGTDGDGKYVLMASYTDAGSAPIESMSGRAKISLRSAKLQAEDFDEAHPSISSYTNEGYTVLGGVNHGRFILFKDLRLDQLSGMELAMFFQAKRPFSGALEVRLDTLDGDLIGEISWEHQSANFAQKKYDIPLKRSVSGQHHLYIIFKHEADPDRYLGGVDWLRLKFD